MATLDNLDDLRVFVRIVEAGSLIGAGRSLNRTANAVSRRLQRLEATVNVRLVQRTTRRMSLTDEGKRFYTQCLRVLNAAADAAAAIAPERGVSGVLRMAIPRYLVSLGIMDGLRAMLDAHPDLNVQLLVSDIPVDAIEHGLDLAVATGPPLSEGIVARKLGVMKAVLAATPGYLDRMGRPEHPKDLSRHDCLCFMNPGLETHWTMVAPDGTPLRVPVSGRFASSESNVLMDALFAGMGIGPRPLADPSLANGQLERVLPDYPFTPFEIYLVLPSGRHHMPRVKLALDLVTATVSPLTSGW